MLLALLAAAGCGGGGEAAEQDVRGSGYAFAAPGSWRIERSGRTVRAVGPDGADVSVTLFALARPYRPALAGRAGAELDALARRLAARLGGEVTRAGRPRLAGRTGWDYAFAGMRDGTRRVAFVLVGRREYQLLCRGDGDDACRRLLASFRLSP